MLRISIRKRTLLIIGSLVTAFAILVCAGAVYQALGTAADARSFPAPGQLVDIGGYRLHILCTGKAKPGTPTVILDHGGGGFGALDLSATQAALSATGRVCAYDRPGYGWSDASPRPRTAQVAADELQRLLVRAQIPGPYVLVADSWGGYSSRVFATQHALEVAGLVLMDVSHENTWKHEEIRNFNIQFGKLMLAGRIAAPTGLWRLLVRTGVLSHPVLQFAPPEQRELIAALTNRTAYWEMVYAETNIHTLDITAEQVRSSRRPLGDLPIVVLTAGDGYPSDKYREHWLADQADLLSLSSRATQRILAGYSHYSLTTKGASIVKDAVEPMLSLSTERISRATGINRAARGI